MEHAFGEVFALSTINIHMFLWRDMKNIYLDTLATELY